MTADLEAWRHLPAQLSLDRRGNWNATCPLLFKRGLAEKNAKPCPHCDAGGIAQRFGTGRTNQHGTPGGLSSWAGLLPMDQAAQLMKQAI